LTDLPGTDRQDENQRSAWHTYVSPPVPPSGSRRATELLHQWETRHLSAVPRALLAVWQHLRRPLVIAGLACTVIFVGAAALTEPKLENLPRMLLERLRSAEGTVKAREGELVLARLEIARLSAIHEFSRKYRIPADLAASIHDIALAEGIDPDLAFSLVRVESGFARRAISSAGAVGLTQVMPATAFWLQPGLSYDDLFERDTNLRLGFRYLKMLMKQYRGDLHLALLAYNRGPSRVDDILQAGGDPSNGYSRVVRAGTTRPFGNE
jgi:hypothetical protein